MGRDVNLIKAMHEPEEWLVGGSKDFLRFLKEHGVKNYFVTGAVIEHAPDGAPCGSMYEEVQTLGLLDWADDFCGSTWDVKLPKDLIMQRICKRENIAPKNVLVVGDGRSEIAAGVAMNALTISRLDATATRAREIHRKLKSNIIVENYKIDNFRRICNCLI